MKYFINMFEIYKLQVQRNGCVQWNIFLNNFITANEFQK